MKHNFKDLSGQKFGRLTVVARAGLTTARCVLWHCLCDCGETSTVAGNDLRRGHTEQCKACGYAAQSRKAKDWTGEVVGSFTVVRLISRGRWEVTCHDCHDSFNRSGDWLRQAGVCPTCHARGRAAAIEADKQERTSQRTRVCTVCGDEFNYTHIEGEIDRRNCSRDCYEKRKRSVNAMRRRARN